MPLYNWIGLDWIGLDWNLRNHATLRTRTDETNTIRYDTIQYNTIQYKNIKPDKSKTKNKTKPLALYKTKKQNPWHYRIQNKKTKPATGRTHTKQTTRTTKQKTGRKLSVNHWNSIRGGTASSSKQRIAYRVSLGSTRGLCTVKRYPSAAKVPGDCCCSSRYCICVLALTQRLVTYRRK